MIRAIYICLLSILAMSNTFGATVSRIRVERKPIPGGAELITWFERLPQGGEFPVLSALDDTLSSDTPGDDRLRQVWVFTFAPPSLAQRAESAIPFLYHRLWNEGSSGSTRAHPIFDMGAPAKGVWTRVGMAALQAEVINPAGAIARLTTRSYGGNLGEYKTTHAWEALDVISVSDPVDTNVSKDEFTLLQSRLELNGHMFGGLVSDQVLPDFYEKYETARTEGRAHNWELLRQSAEENGLYFQPLTIGGMVNSFAMVWVAREDLPCGDERHPRQFDAQFLKIANPFEDKRVCGWTGYTQMWHTDDKPASMIPLALYSLDYPGTPLPLVDFRHATAPTRSEMTLRFADDMTLGVLGLTGFGLTHLSYQAAKAGWLFVYKRHGAATDRAMRRRAFVQLRHALGTDDSLDPALRKQLASRVEKLDIDPLERSWDQEVREAWAQYDALVKSADDPDARSGLPCLLDADRVQEAGATAHGPAARVLLRVAAISTFGIYRHRDELTPAKWQKLAESRRQASSKRVPVLPAAQQSGLAGAGE